MNRVDSDTCDPVDSDENEHYVYPYSGNESNAPGIHRPLSVRSTPASLLDSKKRKGFGEWLRQTLYNKPPQPAVDEEEEDLFWSSGEQQQSQQRRPKLRNHVKDLQQQQSNKSSLLNLWHDSFNKKYANPLSKKSSTRKYYSTQKHSPPYLGHTNRNGGYTSDDEEAPLLSRRQKRSFSKPKKTWYVYIVYKCMNSKLTKKPSAHIHSKTWFWRLFF